MLVITGTIGLLVPALALATLSSKPEDLAGHSQARLELAGHATLIEPPLLMTHGGDVLDTTTLETSARACERVAGVLERVGVLAAKTGRRDLEKDTERIRKRIQRLHGRLEDAARESRRFLQLQGRHRLAMALLIRALRQHALGSLYGEFLALRQAARELDSDSDEEDRKRVDAMRQRFRSHVQTSPLNKDRRDSILAALDAHRRAGSYRDESARAHKLEGYGDALHTLERQM